MLRAGNSRRSNRAALGRGPRDHRLGIQDRTAEGDAAMSDGEDTKPPSRFHFSQRKLFMVDRSREVAQI